MDLINELGELYNLAFVKKIDDIEILGSPERSEERFVIEDNNRDRFVAEKVFINLEDRKDKISKTLGFLNNKGLVKAVPYLLNRDNKYLTKLSNGSVWQVIDYISGEELNRPYYAFESWRGKECVDFILELKRFSMDLPFYDKGDVFSIKNYISDLMNVIKVNNFEIYEKLFEIQLFLEKDFFKIEDRLNISFAHGDFHPLNIIWSKDAIKAVIDWEFCGIKHEIYDLSNMIGCLGIELPDAIAGPFVEELFLSLKKYKIFGNLSYKYLLDYIIALRFAWMSEWLRKKDEEMINLELTYMNLLIDNHKEINRIWNLV